MSLECSAKAEPSATYKWQKMTSGSGTQVATGPNLVYLSTQRSHSGYYMCIVQNNVGVRNSLQTFVDVLYLDTPTLTAIGPTTVIEGNKLHLSCSTSANPQAKLSWFRQGQTNPILVDNNVLIFEKMRREQAGTYYCVSENSVGQKQSTMITVVSHYLDSPNATVIGPAAVVEGVDVMLLCSASANPPPLFFWYIQGQLTPISSGISKYLLSNIKREQAKSYYCRIQNILGSKSTAHLNIEVYYLDQPTVLSNPIITTGYFQEGNQLELNCNTSSKPVAQYQWFRNGIIIPSGTTVNYKFTIATRNHAGNYTCQAVNSKMVPKTSTPFYLDISYIDSAVLVISPATTVKEGTTMQMQCKYDANPMPSFKWFKNGIFIQYTKFQLTTTASRSHIGKYFCEIANRAGTKRSSSIIADVTYLDNPTISGNTNKEYKEGEIISFVCSAVGGPAPMISWYKNGNLYKGNTQALTFNTLHRNDAGVYHCTVTNSFGTKQTTSFSLKVQYLDPPSLTANKQDINENERLILTCNVHSYPLATVEWRKSNQLVSDQVTLQKPSIKRTDAGVYSCTATNVLGNKASSITIRVHYLNKPVIQHSIGSTVSPGATISMTCFATGVPAPALIWKRNQDILSNKKTLEIKKATSQNNGIYQCEATNTRGTQISNTLTLTVTDIVCGGKTDPCSPGGTCDASGKSCTCKVGYEGTLCQNKLNAVLVDLVIVSLCPDNNNCYDSATLPSSYLDSTSSNFMKTRTVIGQDLSTIGSFYSVDIFKMVMASIHAQAVVYLSPSYVGTYADIKKIIDDYFNQKGNLINTTMVVHFGPLSSTVSDIDECQTNRHLCSSHATCTNTQLSYSCKCKTDYEGNGITCTEKTKSFLEREMLPIAAGSVGGFFLLLILIILVISAVRRRKTKQRYRKSRTSTKFRERGHSFNDYEFPDSGKDDSFLKLKMRARQGDYQAGGSGLCTTYNQYIHSDNGATDVRKNSEKISESDERKAVEVLSRYMKSSGEENGIENPAMELKDEK